MRVKYNAPVVLTFTMVSAAVLLLSLFVLPKLTEIWFTVGGKGSFNPTEIRSWVTLLTHVLGHANWAHHFLPNFALILLIGPILEENYGSRTLLLMIIITALITGVLNILFFTSGLAGASGIVFMMILLGSFTNFRKGEIPLTFILVLLIFLGRQLYESISNNDISEFAHIVGGFCGSLFGFFRPQKIIRRT